MMLICSFKRIARVLLLVAWIFSKKASFDSLLNGDLGRPKNVSSKDTKQKLVLMVKEVNS